MQLLTLSSARLAEGLDYWHTDQRDARLASRPLVLLSAAASPARIRILPRQIDAARRLFHNYWWAARLPWPNLPQPIKEALSAWAQTNQRAFEKHTVSVVKEAGLTLHRPTLTPPKAARHGLTIPGEIDLLIADPRHRRLWVVELKDPNVPYGADQIYFEIEDFLGRPIPDARPSRRGHRKSYVDSLCAKTEAVRQNIPAALDAVGANGDSPTEWEVRPLMVTPHPVAAAFVANPQVPFRTIAELRDFLVA